MVVFEVLFNFFLLYSAHVHDVDIKMSKKSIKAIGEIAMRLSEVSEYCIDVLLTFLTWEIEYITSETLVVIRSKYNLPV